MELENTLEDYPNRIAGFFAGKAILITGGTGFIGKVLMEKILRTCDDVSKIYVLIRTKRDEPPNERLHTVFESELFDMLREQKTEKIFNKVTVIAGDVSALRLGISDADRALLVEEVHFVFHCAASVRFDEPLRDAVLLNVRGTKQMLELAHQMKKLHLFVHVSTAYCHTHESVLYEKPYPPPASPHHLIDMMEWMDEDAVNAITGKILGDWPNTYSFTKALSEGLVNEELNKLPIILLRPSIVVPIWKDPLPGWTDNLNGPTGLIIGAAKGIVRTMYCNAKNYSDFIPVDIAVNGILCASSDFLQYGERNIFNLTTSSEYKISWEEIIQIVKNVIETKVPFNWVIWYPGGSMKKSRILHNICVLLFHLIPAIFLDCILFCMGYKPVLLKMQMRVLKGFKMLEYYANNEWDFRNEMLLTAREKMNVREKITYCLYGDGMNSHYIENCMHAARLYILNEPIESIPTARRHMKIMFIVDKLAKTLLMAWFVYLICTKVFQPILDLCENQ